MCNSSSGLLEEKVEGEALALPSLLYPMLCISRSPSDELWEVCLGGEVTTALDWDSEDLDSIPSSTTSLLGELRQVISSLFALVSPYVKWRYLLCEAL